MPHNHLMWAVIGIYTGREDNIFWRRIADSDGGRIEIAAAKSLGKMPSHSGTTSSTPSAIPLQRLTGAIHVYGGDFFGVCRSQWDPETLFERPYGFDENSRLFEAANPMPRL